jgi:hypothetical protein
LPAGARGSALTEGPKAGDLRRARTWGQVWLGAIYLREKARVNVLGGASGHA